MEAQEYKGVWWRPSQPDFKVAGILYYVPGEEIRLELIGTFDTEHKDTIAVILDAKSEDVLHGQASDGTNITLFDNLCHIKHAGRAQFATVDYKAREIAFGMHLDSLDDKRFFKAEVRIPELSYWLYPAAVQHTFENTENGHGIYVKFEDQKTEDREVAKIEIKKGLSACLCRNASFQSGEFSFKPAFEQFTTFQIESKKETSLKELYVAAVRFERFLSLATLREVGFSELRLFSKEYYFHITKEKISFKPVFVDTTFHQKPSTTKIEKHRFLFDYNNIATQYPKAIKKWYANDQKFDAIRGHFLDSIDYHGPFSYINFLVVIQAVEGYGTRYLRKEISAYRKTLPKEVKTKKLHDILSVIFHHYSDVKIVNQDTDLEAIVETRNYHSHLLPHRGKKCVDGFELYDLTDELRRVLICCILTYLGFTNKEIDQLTNNCYSDIIRR